MTTKIPASTTTTPGITMPSWAGLSRRTQSDRGHPLKVPIKTKVPCTGFHSPDGFFFG
jgi:hypothetical protein